MKYILIAAALLSACSTTEKKTNLQSYVRGGGSDFDMIVIKVKPKAEFKQVKYGERSQNVMHWQILLVKHGASFNPTGYYGSLTHNAVINFNYKHGIDSDDPTRETWAKLQR